MTLDSSIEQLASTSEIRTGSAVETQAFHQTPAGRIFTTLVQPAEPSRDTALLFCHSYAWEQYELYPLELRAARRAAAAGMPAMTMQSVGYGDAGGSMADATPATHVRDALAAAALLRERSGAASVIPVGASFGSVVAALVAADLSAPGVVLWNPVEPGKFLDAFLRAVSVAGMFDEDDGSAGEAEEAPRQGFRDMIAALEAGETVDLLGYPVTPAFYRGAKDIDLEAVARDGAIASAQIVIVDPVSKRAATRLAELPIAAEVTVEEAVGPDRRAFAPAIPRGGHLATNLELFEDIITRTVRWTGGR